MKRNALESRTARVRLVNIGTYLPTRDPTFEEMGSLHSDVHITFWTRFVPRASAEVCLNSCWSLSHPEAQPAGTVSHFCSGHMCRQYWDCSNSTAEFLSCLELPDPDIQLSHILISELQSGNTDCLRVTLQRFYCVCI